MVIVVLLLQSAQVRGLPSRAGAARAAPMREKYLPLAATIAVFAALFVAGGLLYNHFLSTLVLGDILADNAFIIIAAIGATFVILSGGIDLSIGSMIGFVGVVMANLDAARLASARVGRGDGRFRRRFWRAAGLYHRFLRDPAVHHHARGPVPAARRLLHGQSRFVAAAPSLRRGFRRARPSAARRRFSGEFGDGDAGRAGTSGASSRIAPRSAPTSTRSAATALRPR